MAVIHRGANLTNALQEMYTLGVSNDNITEVVTIRYLTHKADPRSLIPAFGYPPPASTPSRSLFPAHGRTKFSITREKGSQLFVDITYEITLALPFPTFLKLPPITEQWQGGYDQSHLSLMVGGYDGSLPSQSTVLGWLGNPKTTNSSGTAVSDFRGIPEDAQGVGTRKKFEQFLTGTMIYTRTSYSWTRPNFTQATSRSNDPWQQGYIYTPPSITPKNTGRFLKLWCSAEHDKSKGWYQITEPWMYAGMPNSPWDTDLYNNTGE